MERTFINTSVHVTAAFKLHTTSVPPLQRDVTTHEASGKRREATGVLFHRQMRQHHNEGVHDSAEQSLRTQDIAETNPRARSVEATGFTDRQHG